MSSTRGYAEEAPGLIARYEQLAFEDKHRDTLALLPRAPSTILDVGAGTGADAAWLAARGHRVVAVEPVSELREPGRALHPSAAIEWLDDGLPRLDRVVAMGRPFDAILLTAVWMHLDEAERHEAMPILASLLVGNGVLVMTLRHGPVPEGRRMFDVQAGEVIAQAKGSGLACVLELRSESINPANRAAGVWWTRLGFRRP